MSEILAFTGSNSETSINDQLLRYALSLLSTSESHYEDLKLLEVPIYSEVIEQRDGIPKDILRLKSKIDEADALMIAVNEHNGSMSAFFKNITDWLSRTDSKYLLDKPIFVLASSPGQGGGKFCLDYTTGNFQKFGGHVLHRFSLPLFSEHFINSELQGEHKSELQSLISNFEKDIN